MAHLRGEMTLADATICGQADTRAYVKRQFTWFRQQLPGFMAVTPDEAESALLAMVEPGRNERSGCPAAFK
jgi:tRNA dimethylallyltransferase